MPIYPRFAALICALASVATPTGATTELLGGGFLVGHGTCAEYGWVGTQQVLARMEPQGAPGNLANETQMSLMLSTGTIAFRFNNHGSYRYTEHLLSATYVWNGPWTPDAPTMNFSWNYYGNIPGTRDVALDKLIIDFENFNEHPGCRMSAYLVMHRN